MPDLQAKLHRAIELAAEYELLGSLAATPEKRAEARRLAAFHQEVAAELRQDLAAQGTRTAKIVGLDCGADLA